MDAMLRCMLILHERNSDGSIYVSVIMYVRNGEIFIYNMYKSCQ